MTTNVPSSILERIINATPVKRLGHPEEVARAVLLLIDEESGFIIGETLSINGGYHISYLSSG